MDSLAAPVSRRLSVQDVARLRSSPTIHRPAPKAAGAGRALGAAGKAAGLAIPGVGEAELALGAISEAGKILTGDLVTIQYPHVRARQIQIPGQRKKRTVIATTNYTIHVNPLGIGLGAIGLGVAAFLGMASWQGITISSGLGNKTQIAPGLKDSFVGKIIGARIPGSSASKACTDLYNKFVSIRDAELAYEAANKAEIVANITDMEDLMTQARAQGCSWPKADWRSVK